MTGVTECKVLDRRDGTLRSSFPVRSPLGLLAEEDALFVLEQGELRLIER